MTHSLTDLERTFLHLLRTRADADKVREWARGNLTVLDFCAVVHHVGEFLLEEATPGDRREFLHGGALEELAAAVMTIFVGDDDADEAGCGVVPETSGFRRDGGL